MENALLILGTAPKKNFNFDLDKAKKMDFLERYNYIYPDRMMNFEKMELYLRSYKEEKQLFLEQGIEREDIFSNTLDIADSVGSYPYHEKLDLLPNKYADAKQSLRDLIEEGLLYRGKQGQQPYRDRVNEELEVIEGKGFSLYFLIVAWVLKYCHDNNIRTGYGRGSGAGSLVNYLLRITEIDPIVYNTLFFRFLDPTRPDWPDVDIDISDHRRGEVQDAVRKEFGEVANVMTITKFKSKSSIKAAARVLGIPDARTTKALKHNDPPAHLADELTFYDWFIRTNQGKAYNDEHPEVVELARMIFGQISQFGQHPSAMVLSKEPVEHHASMQTVNDKKTGRRVSVAALDMHEVEDVGFVKMDFLGLKALSIIEDSIAHIKNRHGIDIDILSIDESIPEIYAMLSKGLTKGIFQFEQPASTSLLFKMGGVKTMEELTAATALVRPGAEKTIGPEYIARKKGEAMVEYVHEDTRYFSENTYGLLTLYQEQQMLACVELAGMSMEEANGVRRGLGKKKIEIIKPYREKFITGATPKIGAAKAEKIWEDLELGAGYNFNLSHSVAYAKLAYATAWLKYFYPAEFMAAVIANEDEKDAVTDYLIESRRMGLKVLIPHVSKSDLRAAPEGDKAIRLGLTNVKYCGDKVAPYVILNRPYEDFEDFKAKVMAKKSGMNIRVIKAFDAVGGARFKDNPLRGDESESFYELLQIPAFPGSALDPRVECQITKASDFTEDGVAIIKGLLRNVINRGTWARLDILDETGSVQIFCDPNIEIEPDEHYVFLTAGNSVVKHVKIDKVDEDSSNLLVRWLYGLNSELPEGKHQTLAFKERKTLAGKWMANMVAIDHNGILHDILVWPSDFDSAKEACKPGRVWDYKVKQKTDSESKFLDMNVGGRRWKK